MLRLIWWWLPEIGLTITLVYGWMLLATHTPLWARFAVVGLVLGGRRGRPGPPPAHRLVLVPDRPAPAAGVLRPVHRREPVRFAAADRFGPPHPGRGTGLDLPAARPVPRRPDRPPGQDRRGCHASAVLVERASERTAAWLRIDVKRREILTATIGSPLVEAINPDAPVSTRPWTSLPRWTCPTWQTPHRPPGRRLLSSRP